MGSIFVLAGTNGAGKSSIGGELLVAEGVGFHNPDEAARKLRTANPGLSEAEANGLAWQQGAVLLQRAIERRGNFAFETTLGGETMTRLLASAIDAGLEVHVWYTGLANVDLHVSRVQARVALGGHDIPESTIRRRFVASRLNLIRLLPRLASLRVYDNSAEADPARGLLPQPALILRTDDGKVVEPGDLRDTPEWAKPIVVAALRNAAGNRSASPLRKKDKPPRSRR